MACWTGRVGGLTAAALATGRAPAPHSVRCRKAARCQPNFRRGALSPDPQQQCGPYKPLPRQQEQEQPPEQQAAQGWPSEHAHDTIAMVVVSADGSVAAGASSNGAIHKVPGRVGDAAVPGGGAYADSEVGGCGSTGPLPGGDGAEPEPPRAALLRPGPPGR